MIDDDINMYANNKILINHTRFFGDAMMTLIPFFEKNEEIIEYEINEWGFRGKFDFEKDLAFGCSKTYGYELNVLKSWPSMMGLNNLGVCGGSIQTVARLVSAWVPKVKPKAIYVAEPEPARREIFYGNTYTNLTMGNLGVLTNILYREGNHTAVNTRAISQFCIDNPGFNILDDDENKKLAQEARTKIENICEQNNTKVFYMEESQQPKFDVIGSEKSELARDLWHPGEPWNNAVVEKFRSMED